MQRVMNFSTKKRPRKDAWKELQSELDEREKLEEENSAKQRRLDALRARACIEGHCVSAYRLAHQHMRLIGTLHAREHGTVSL